MTNSNPWTPPNNEDPERPARPGSILIIAVIVLLCGHCGCHVVSDVTLIL
ncbi:hypothetical protein [Corynebacterium striatum]|nr:hypothetical protein [Corynebacterium striatum]MDC7106326.1 hypothetical protein [Corynebacterium striatum]